MPCLLPLLRDQVREGMGGLADAIVVRMSLDDLIVPEPARAVLDQIVARQRNRALVLDQWGFRHSGGGPQGISVLFAGPSGTGKTMAAEALAHALALDLFRVDLSRIVDKYHRRDREASRGAVRRGQLDRCGAAVRRGRCAVRPPHRSSRQPRPLCQSRRSAISCSGSESYRGIAILTTNLPNAIDDAFSRRFAFSLHFEFPAIDERRRIWRRAFPAEAPTGDLDWDKVARLSLSGGQIRLVVVNAAMLAAEEGNAIGMPHIARALINEYGQAAPSRAACRARGVADLKPQAPIPAALARPIQAAMRENPSSARRWRAAS